MIFAFPLLRALAFNDTEYDASSPFSVDMLNSTISPASFADSIAFISFVCVLGTTQNHST